MSTKPLVRLTRRAFDVFCRIVDQQRLSDDAILKIEVEKGDRGYRYRLFVEEICDVEDVVFRANGILVAVKRKDADFIEGSTIDFQEGGPGGSGFSVDNPNEPRSAASDPSGLRLSRRKLREFHPELTKDFLKFEEEQAVRHLMEHLTHGDCRAAVVILTVPLLVAAYTDELDCVAMVRFPIEMAGEYKLRKGSRLLSVNMYSKHEEGTDLIPGPENLGRWSNFAPIIADFFSDDEARIMFRKRQIEEAEWERCRQLGKEYVMRHGRETARQGAPLHSWKPAF